MSNNSCKISVVSPVYRAENTVDDLVIQIKQVLKTLTEDFEIVLVEDGGPDNSWAKILENCTKDTRVKGIKLSRNFGQHYAISAGLEFSKGDWVIVMDCDLQDRPDQITKLYNKAIEGYDIVLARRSERQDGFIKRMSSYFFYRVLGYLSGLPQDNKIANYGIYQRKVIDAIKSMPEAIKYFPTMVKWVGFKRTEVDVEHAERLDGVSTYNFKRLRNLALDIILAYSDKPLKLIIKFGFSISLMALLFALYTLCSYLAGNIVVLGYASLIISIWFLSGIIMLILGIVGLYVGKILVVV